MEFLRCLLEYFYTDRSWRNNNTISMGKDMFDAMSTEDPEKLKEWYKTHLGFNVDAYGSTFWWNDGKSNPASTQWSPFDKNTKYFSPSNKDCMFNYRVKNVVNLLANLEKEGVTVIDKIEECEYGKFGWIIDIEGNKIELWEPIDKAFQ